MCCSGGSLIGGGAFTYCFGYSEPRNTVENYTNQWLSDNYNTHTTEDAGF